MQEVVFSMVPGAAPVLLERFYEAFRDYYVDCEPQTKRWAVENVREDWTVFDIGANVGVYACLFGRLAHLGKVYCFEPTDTVEMLRANLEANAVSNAECHRLAVGARTGGVKDKIYRIWGSAPEEGSYDFTTLDDFVESRGITRIDCVKIDVDGFDLEVLQGAEKTLRRFNPWIIIELNHALATRELSVSDALMWLRGMGYGSALAMDKENFLLRREQKSPTGDGISISFDRDPVLLEPLFGPGETLPAIFGDDVTLHNGAAAIEGEAGAFHSSTPRWAFMASWAVVAPPQAAKLILEVDIEATSGTVGVGCLGPDWKTYLGREVQVETLPGVQTVGIHIEDAASIAALMTRSNGKDGADTRFRIVDVRIKSATPLPSRRSALMERSIREFDLEQCLPGGNASRRKPVEIVPVSELGKALGFAEIYAPPRLVYPYGLADFKTEIDESEIYRFIYRNWAPRRHLEFGTWEGFGATLCASSCDAEIWTVDLPTGELDASGNAVYGERNLPGDVAHENEPKGIGWRYREAGFSQRVHQILGDSRRLDVSQFGPGSFDSILIDGGHTAEIVVSDTLKALPLLRSGGLMIWHDFCPDPDVLARSEAGQGVVEGLKSSFDQWRGEFQRLFWLRPSWLLVGIRK